MEPTKCEGWQFISWAQLCAFAEQDMQASTSEKKMLFQPMVEIVKQRRSSPFELL
jgi:hypothetical protein